MKIYSFNFLYFLSILGNHFQQLLINLREFYQKDISDLNLLTNKECILELIKTGRSAFKYFKHQRFVLIKFYIKF